MTKSQWNKIEVGTKVVHETRNHDNTPKLCFGTIIRINSNGSQALVRFDTGTEIWYGRTGIELAPKE